MNLPTRITQLTVFYDGRCALCSTFAETISQLKLRFPVYFIPYQHPRAREIFPPLDRFHPEREMISLSREGDLYRGAESWVLCLYATQIHHPLAERLAHPRLLPLAKRAALLVGRHRRFLSQLLLSRKDAELARRLHRVARPPECHEGRCTLTST